jgi:hypothetical protein
MVSKVVEYAGLQADISFHDIGYRVKATLPTSPSFAFHLH